MTTKWQSAVPAIPPSWSQTFTLYFIPFTAARGNSSAQNLLVAPNTLRVKAKVLVPYKCPSIWPHCLSDFICYHFSLLVLPHHCSSDQQNLLLHQAFAAVVPSASKVLFPDLHMVCLPFDFLQSPHNVTLAKESFLTTLYIMYTWPAFFIPLTFFNFLRRTYHNLTCWYFYLLCISPHWKTSTMRAMILSHSFTVLSPAPRTVWQVVVTQ